MIQQKRFRCCDWLRRIIPLNAHKKAQNSDANSGGDKPYNNLLAVKSDRGAIRPGLDIPR